MSEEKNHIIYTADDIKKYITGAMSPAEMHAIEMAALDDPLLAEAMEGYDLMEQKDWSKELAALKLQFNKTEKKEALVIPIGNKANTFKWWKSAAAVLVLGATAITAYIFTNSNNETAVTKDVASIEKSITDAAVSIKTDSIKTFATITPAADSIAPLLAKVDKVNAAGAQSTTAQGAISTEAYSPIIQEREITAIKPAAKYDDLAVNERKDAAKAKEYRADEAASGNASNNADVALNEREFKNKAEESITSTDKAKASNNGAYYNNTANSFSGLVVTQDNKPVSYANINIPQAKKPVLTDANGRFTLTALDTTVKVTVSSAGYTSQKFTLQNSASQNTIVMQPQDVVTQALGKRRDAVKKRQAAVADSTDVDDEEAEPAGGWVEYNNYLNQNLKFPADARQSNLHGEVEVTVKLKNNGDISTVKIAKPLCPECDAEAVRLVKEGPKWDVKNNKKNKVKVKVKF